MYPFIGLAALSIGIVVNVLLLCWRPDRRLYVMTFCALLVIGLATVPLYYDALILLWEL